MKLNAETETETQTEIAEVYARPDTYVHIMVSRELKT